MKVLQLGKFYPIKGGVEKVMEIFTEGLAERGFASDMLCASHNGETTDIVFSEESRIFRTKTLTKLAATMISPEMIFRLRRICSEYDPCTPSRSYGYIGPLLFWIPREGGLTLAQ